MFISEEESQRRLRTEENLLNRVPRSDSLSLPSEEILPPALPSVEDILNISEAPRQVEIEPKERRARKAKGPINFELANVAEAEAALDKLLRGDNGYAGRGMKGLHRDEQAGIGTTASILGTTRASRLGDVSIPEAHAYERAYTSPNDIKDPRKSPKEDLRNKIIEGHGIIVDKCFERLLFTLGLLDDQKLSEVKRATDLSVIAKNLSGVVAHATHATQDKNTEINDNNVHFHIMRPERALEAEYKTVEINTEREEKAYEDLHREG